MLKGDVIQDGPWAGFNVVSVYTRKQAIADGVLVDLSASFPTECRMYKWPVACTSTVWAMIERAAEDEGCEVAVYAWDVVYMSYMAVQAAKSSGTQLLYKVCLPIGKPEKLLKFVCGPGDSGEPVITIMLAEED